MNTYILAVVKVQVSVLVLPVEKERYSSVLMALLTSIHTEMPIRLCCCLRLGPLLGGKWNWISQLVGILHLSSAFLF